MSSFPCAAYSKCLITALWSNRLSESTFVSDDHPEYNRRKLFISLLEDTLLPWGRAVFFFLQLVSSCLTHTGLKHTVWVRDAAFLTFVRITENPEDSSIPDTDLWSVIDSSEPCSMSYEIRAHEVQKRKIKLINYTALTDLFISAGKQIRLFMACPGVSWCSCALYHKKKYRMQSPFMDTLWNIVLFFFLFFYNIITYILYHCILGVFPPRIYNSLDRFQIHHGSDYYEVLTKDEWMNYDCQEWPMKAAQFL